MTFSEWIKENSCEYKGHTIRPGAIEKDGEVVCVFVCGLDTPKEEVFQKGRIIIDERLVQSQ